MRNTSSKGVPVTPGRGMSQIQEDGIVIAGLVYAAPYCATIIGTAGTRATCMPCLLRPQFPCRPARGRKRSHHHRNLEPPRQHCTRLAGSFFYVGLAGGDKICKDKVKFCRNFLCDHRRGAGSLRTGTISKAAIPRWACQHRCGRQLQ